jgi:predicted ATPase/DNA-binding SARP family transcriptional activator
MSEKPFKILLLGSPIIQVNGQPIQIKRRIVRSAMFYLACQAHPISRSDLILLLWPDEPDSSARANVRDLLSKLRSQLPDPNLLILQDDLVGLDNDRIWVDVLEFRKLAIEALHTCELNPYNQPLPADVVSQMENAVGMWRIQRFLAGSSLPSNWEFEQWATLSSTELESLRLSMLEKLARHYYLAATPEAAMRYLRAAIETDELNFDLHALMLACLDQLGRANEAVNYCRYLRSLLDNNGFDEMPAHLQKFCEKFQPIISSQKQQRVEWPITLQIRTPFIGRQSSMQLLHSSFQDNGYLVVKGEAGIGKTRLMYEFYRRLIEPPRLILLQCNPNEIELPLMPLREALRRSISREIWTKLDKIMASQLQSLFPEMDEWQQKLQAPLINSPQENRFILFEAIRQLLTLFSDNHAICVLVEDAHWAEEETISFLRYLCDKGFFQGKHRLVLTLREDVQNPLLTEMCRSLQFFGSSVSIHLPALTHQEIAELSQSLLGREIDDQVCAQLSEETGGNPLFLIEILQSISLSHLDEQDISAQLHNTPLPGSMRSLVRDRLQLLQATEQQVLLTAALIGRTFEPVILESATGYHPEQVTAALEILERNHLIQVDPQYPSPGSYKFVHEKIRELLVQDLSTARRRLTHLRIARAMENQGQVGINRAAILAVHFEFGGDPQRAFYYWMQAANYARRLHSRPSAYSAYTRADHLVRQQEHMFSDEDILLLYTTWGELAYDLNDIETVASVYHTLERIGQERGSRQLVGSALSGAASLDMLKFKIEEGQVFIERALALLETTDDILEQMKAYLRLGNLLVNQNRHREAAKALETAIQRAGDSKHPRVTEVRLNAEHRLALVYNMAGWPEKALQHAEIALNESLREYLPLITLKTRSVLAYILFYLGNYEAAYREGLNGILQADAAQHFRIAGYLNAVVARVQLARGFLDDSWRFAKQAMEIGRQWNYPDVLSEAYGVFGDLHRLAGDYEQACRYYGRGIEVGIENFQTLNNMARLGICRIEAGDSENGLHTLEKAMYHAYDNDLGTIYLLSKVGLFLQRVRMGHQFENEEEEFEQLHNELINRKMATLPFTLNLARGQLALNRGQLEEARQHWKSVIAGEKKTGNFWPEFAAQRMLYQHLPDCDPDKQAAKEYLSFAVRTLKENTTQSSLKGMVEQLEEKYLKKS